MRNLKLIIFLTIIFGPATIFAAQQVGDISIDYVMPFHENSAKAQIWKSKMNPELRDMLRKFQVYEATGTSNISEIRVITILYNDKIRSNIDSSAGETIANIVQLPGIKNPTHRVTRTTVSEQDARRISYESERNGGMLGAEFLIIQDKRNKAAHQIQIIFSKKPELNPLSTMNLDEQRIIAKRILDSVKLAQ